MELCLKLEAKESDCCLFPSSFHRSGVVANKIYFLDAAGVREQKAGENISVVTKRKKRKKNDSESSDSLAGNMGKLQRQVFLCFPSAASGEMRILAPGQRSRTSTVQR